MKFTTTAIAACELVYWSVCATVSSTTGIIGIRQHFQTKIMNIMVQLCKDKTKEAETQQ